jgi:hypothetical protein
MLYFDNSPSGHYGTIRQQIWSVFHFPLHLSIVGVVEGSQQIALARYVSVQADKIDRAFWTACTKNHLDGVDLVKAFVNKLSYYQFEKKADSAALVPLLNDWLFYIGNSTGVCSPANTTQFSQTYAALEYPVDVQYLWYNSMGALYSSLGVKIPDDKKRDLVEIMLDAWRVVYIYYWSCLTIFLLCSLVFMILIRKNKGDLFDWISIIIRTLMIILSAALIAVVASDTALYTFISTPAVLPVCLVILFIILVFDRFSGVFANWRLKKSGALIAKDEEEHGGHHEEHAAHGSMDKGASGSLTEHDPLTASTAYERPHTIAMTHMVPAPYAPPPQASPPANYSAGGYAPVHHHG